MRNVFIIQIVCTELVVVSSTAPEPLLWNEEQIQFRSK